MESHPNVEKADVRMGHPTVVTKRCRAVAVEGHFSLKRPRMTKNVWLGFMSKMRRKRRSCGALSNTFGAGSGGCGVGWWWCPWSYHKLGPLIGPCLGGNRFPLSIYFLIVPSSTTYFPVDSSL